MPLDQMVERQKKKQKEAKAHLDYEEAHASRLDFVECELHDLGEISIRAACVLDYLLTKMPEEAGERYPMSTSLDCGAGPRTGPLGRTGSPHLRRELAPPDLPARKLHGKNHHKDQLLF